jgi:hypothetical protein
VPRFAEELQNGADQCKAHLSADGSSSRYNFPTKLLHQEKFFKNGL